ncbi:MAG: sulfite exporter TauE/SafE family protein [Candidatus Altiarchaeota archaeon]|nr:sulfite exporter TauE/SafE family protein [Candidatus Altiarchaeota archaeon]
MDALTLYSAFVYGLTSSLSLCLASCLPFYMPVLLGFGKGTRNGLMLSLGFVVGRFLGYFSLGAVAAFLGGAFISFFSGVFPQFSAAVVFVFGAVSVFYGSIVLAKAQLKVLGGKRCKTYFISARKYGNPIVGTFFLGFVSTITPCVPVFTFLLLPFALGKVFETSFVTIAFGLGANMVFIFMGVAVGFGLEGVQDRFNNVRRPLEVISALVLIVFGIFYSLWALGPYVFGWGNTNYVLPSLYDFVDFLNYLIS